MAVIGLTIFLIACIGYFGSNGIVLFLVIRFLHGMSYAVASTATSTIASTLIPYSRQGEGIGYFSMFMSIAMVIGPALGLFLWKDENINVLLLGVCVIAALSLLFTLGVRMPKEDKANVIEAVKEPAKTRKRASLERRNRAESFADITCRIYACFFLQLLVWIYSFFYERNSSITAYWLFFCGFCNYDCIVSPGYW